MERYQAIFDYNMTEDEAKAYKMALIWESETKKMFPGESFTKLPAKSDPRKCTLYRYCWKMCRETRGLLKDEEYKLYIIGNLQILRVNKGRIEPNALCGDKAWLRWLVWKRMYEKKLSQMNQTEPPPEANLPAKVIKEISCTKRFLFEKSDGDPSIEKLKSFMDRGSLRVWIGSTKISLYYVILSPWIKKLVGVEKLEADYGFDANLYREKITDDVRRYFQNEFKHEF